MRFRFMRGSSLRRAWRRRRWSRRRTLPLLLPGIEFGLLILLVLRILLHRRSLSYQRVSRRRSGHRRRRWSRRFRLTRCFLRLHGSGSCRVWWRSGAIVCWLLRMRGLVGLHWRLRSRCLSGSWRRLSRSGRLCRCSGRSLRLSWSLRAHIRLRSVRLSKRRAWRRRLPGCNHLSVHRCGRRPYRYGPARSHDTLPVRLHWNAADHRSVLDLSLIHLCQVGLNRARVGESLM